MKRETVIEIIAKAAEGKKANNLKILDVRKVSNILDYLIICSGDSSVQIRAIEKEIDKQLRSNKIRGFRWEGLVKSGWIILDLGNIVVHVMGKEEREYYNLEELWEKEAIIYHY
ncbi:MAG: ribosome silencing factor [Candidatus Margulisiibacteriota bacterium]|nr:ribosome silencing factor [Candidatus Margulisiibacteriota bacterium]